MGFSLPAAIGASFVDRGKDIWVIVGDGSIQMTITELATAVQENANIKIAIINRCIFCLFLYFCICVWDFLCQYNCEL